MPFPGGAELLIILVIVLLLFGVGRITKVGSELGQGIKAFREGMRSGDEENPAENAEPIDAPDAS